MVANVIDLNATEPDEVRWFVDYDPTTQLGITIFFGPEQLLASNPPTTLRTPTPVPFRPSDFDGQLPSTHVLQMAISNGFQSTTTQPSLDGGMPNMEATTNHAVQVFRWFFEPAVDGGCGP